MKATTLIKSGFGMTVMVAMFMLVGCNTTMNAQTKKNLVYDKKDACDIVYSLDNSTLLLTRELKYEYKYDGSGKTIEKKAYRWDAMNNEWEAYYLITIDNKEIETIMEYAQWNPETKDFDRNRQKTIYHMDSTNQLIAYMSYRWDKKSMDWQQDQRHLLQYYLADNNPANK